ncbi:hypothetical protein [Mucilaginibacter sp.]|uniref:hypothetical protein n=1 Tax=Mucilaginibacter sp. TaxID=1882438 RepID=UPI002609C2F8|nr:hypothetical protein [Mucilaginibacter sp.]
MKQKAKWPFKIIPALGVITLFGFIPWEVVFSMEIRNETLQNLANGQLAWGALFFLICACFAKLLQLTKGWLQGMLFMLFPILLFFTGSIWAISVTWLSPQWRDQGIYRNGDDYLVVQIIEYGITGDHIESRLIRTASPYGMIRGIEEQHPLNSNDDIFTRGANEAIYANKTWHKLPNAR